MVELQGRVGANAYIGKDGEAKATITFHVNTIKLYGKGSSKDEAPVKENTAAILEPADDLPF